MRRFWLGLLPLSVIGVVVGGACVAQPAAEIGLVMAAPEGLLDKATGVELSVFDAALAKCSKSGHVNKIPTGEVTQKFALAKSGCAAGVTWCKDIALDKDGTKKMFAVVAKDPTGTIAEGCATATIDQDPLEVPIK